MSNTVDSWYRRYFSRPEAVALVVIAGTAMVVFKTMGNILIPIIVSAVIAYVLKGVVKLLEEMGCSFAAAVTLTFSFFIGFLLLFLLWFLPIFWNEILRMVADIPHMLQRMRELIFKMCSAFPPLASLISMDSLQQSLVPFNNYILNFGRYVVTFSLTSLANIATLCVYLILVPLLVFFFLRDGKEITLWLSNFLPRQRGVLEKLWCEFRLKLHCYIYGKFIEILVVAIVSIIAFGMLGLRHAVLLGTLAGLSVLVPYVGIVVISIPIVIIAMVQWGITESFFYLLLVHVTISVLDANLLVPLLFSEAMDLHPLAIILAVLIFGNLFGFWGIFFAIPLVTMAHLLVKLWPRGE